MFPDAKLLVVDLSKKVITKEILPSETYRQYPGGSALATYLILQDLPAGVDPLSEENILVFSVSPLTGLPISGTSRMVIAAKSPLTGAIGDSQSGGFFPAKLKDNGYDAIIFKGKAERPVYLVIDNETVELHDANEIWGKDTEKTKDWLKKTIQDDSIEIAQIGPGGENLVRYACVLNMCNRANGRTGMGAVMGSKNLKAVVVRKGKKPVPFDQKALISLAKEAKNRMEVNDAVSGLSDVGTAGDLGEFNRIGFLATNNWQSGYSGESAEKLTGKTMRDTILVDRDTCYGCAVRCKRVVGIDGKVDPRYGGPEYETCATFGSYCGVYDLEAVSLANQLCNMYGIDTISCGATISFAMECFEKGLIDSEFTDGLNLHFGNSESMLTLVERIARREGKFATLLGEGSKLAAERIGGGAEEFSMSVKGEELAAHMPQLKPGLGIVYAVNPFGADHQSSDNDPVLTMPEDSQERIWLGQLGLIHEESDSYGLDDNKVRFAFETQCFYSILDTLCLCQFVWGPTWQLYGPDDILKLCKFGIGWETSLFELMKIGERRINMMRAFNAREGFTSVDDRLPKRLFEPMGEGPSQGIQIDEDLFARSVQRYYQMAGWDPMTGNPTEGTLARLSLDWI